MKLILLSMFILLGWAQEKKVIYKYKKYEKFDFDSLDVSGSKGYPGDLSVGSRVSKKFRNKLPERRNFNNEMKEGLNSIR